MFSRVVMWVLSRTRRSDNSFSVDVPSLASNVSVSEASAYKVTWTLSVKDMKKKPLFKMDSLGKKWF